MPDSSRKFNEHSQESMEKLTDGELLESFRDGNSEAYAVLFNRHEKSAIRTALWQSRNYEMAVDAAHEAFASILATMRAGAGPVGTFSGYLHATVIREIRRQLQRTAKETLIGEYPETAALTVPDFSEQLLQTHIGDPSLRRAFQSLPHRWQLVIWHIDINDTPTRQAAHYFGLTPNAVAALHRRAKIGLRQAYVQQQGPPTPCFIVNRFVYAA